MTAAKKYRLKVLGLSLMLCLSIASFAYINSVDDPLQLGEDSIFVEELEEKKGEILPDVQLIKLLMHRTLEFMTSTPRM